MQRQCNVGTNGAIYITFVVISKIGLKQGEEMGNIFKSNTANKPFLK